MRVLAITTPDIENGLPVVLDDGEGVTINSITYLKMNGRF